MKPSLDKWDAFALLLCGLIGVSQIPYPFQGDQAMFMMAARKLHAGGMLYHDFWDFKQPGIYWFFMLGSSLFGFTEVGVHTLECIVMWGGSLALLLTLKQHLAHKWIGAIAAVFFQVWYYGIANDWHRTQVEVLAGVPLLIIVALFSEAGEEAPSTDRVKGLLAGVCAAAALLLKLAFLPLVMGPALIDGLYYRHQQKSLPSRCLTFYLIGILVPLAGTASYFALRGSGHEALDANFFYPGNLIHQYPPNSYVVRMRSSLLWFLRAFYPLLALGIFAFLSKPSPKARLLSIQIFYWLLAGFLVIFVQWYSHWEYHFFLLFVPVLLLAALGLDALSARLAQAKYLSGPQNVAVITALSVLLSVSPLATIARRSLALANSDFALSPKGRAEYYASQSTDNYGPIDKEVEFLKQPGSLSGPLLVIGNPLYYTLSGRDQAGAQNGWAPDLMLAQNRRQIVSDLRNHPPPYVLIVGDFETAVVRQRFQDLSALLQAKYEVIHSDDAKVWYRLRKPSKVP